MAKKIKVFDYTWHVPHQYDMMQALKEECEFFHCLNAKKQWDYLQRPKPDNLTFVYSYQPNFYDLAILHIDQEIVIPGNQKRRIYDEFDSVIRDIPKIVINHGSPVFSKGFKEAFLGHLIESDRQKICIDIVKDLIGNKRMVVNSYTSASNDEWGFGIPIVHGINPNEWMDITKEPQVFTALSPFGFDEYYNRECMLDFSDILHEKYGYTLSYSRLNVDTSSSIDYYKSYMGKSLLYIDTSFRTPMNRARTEAFLSGCCVIQVQGAHDLERWAKDKYNIILVPNDPNVIAETVVDFLENRFQEAINIGKMGKEMAIKTFSPERYRTQWINLINETIN